MPKAAEPAPAVLTPAKLAGDGQLLDLHALASALRHQSDVLTTFQHAIKEADRLIAARFLEGEPAATLVPLRSALVDAVVTRLWAHTLGELGTRAALVAVGGYGRGELHPGSDVDLLILLPEHHRRCFDDAVERFIVLLWDVGLEVGHSVRTVAECVAEGNREISVATNMMESRLLTGDTALFDAMQTATGPDHIWPSRTFFEAKWAEQVARHERYHDTAYNLEPNVKESPGGLRDIHMVGWVAKRHFNADSLHGLVDYGFLTESEYADLRRGQHYLWDVRFALHVVAGRREDRLLFDYQTLLASRFGYQDAEHALAVEQFMQRYYRTIMRLNRLNEMLLQLYQEAILHTGEGAAPHLLNKRFQINRGFLETTHRRVFRRQPFALLEVFLLIQQHPEARGVRAATIRLMREHRHLVDESFRRDLRCRSLFMEILRQPQGVTHALRRMHAYGILGRYIPAFGRITGRMQYDLFHTYTVDSHTLMVVRNLRRLAMDEHVHEFPACSRLMQRVPKPELLYLAGLFHDIAKGRGGDHSELGADEAYEFCVQHGLPRYDSRLVAWLVRHHLLMSMTAQRRDISDPRVINEFAAAVGDGSHLDSLYLLTVADIRGTNPKLWNSWRQALLLELYRLTSRALRRGSGNPIDDGELISETQAQARRALRAKGLHHMTVRAIWRHFTPDYFLRYAAREIAWHTAAIHAHRRSDPPLVAIEPHSPRGGSELFVYTRDRDNIFALTVSALDQLNLDIQDARIITTSNGYTLDSYLILGDDGQPVSETQQQRAITSHVARVLTTPEQPLRSGQRAVPRRLRHFNTATQIAFEDDPHNERTALELITGDRPGLLAQVGYCFARVGIQLQNAKIATIGERAEDVFFITDRYNRPLDDKLCERLRAALTQRLDNEAEVIARGDGV